MADVARRTRKMTQILNSVTWKTLTLEFGAETEVLRSYKSRGTDANWFLIRLIWSAPARCESIVAHAVCRWNMQWRLETWRNLIQPRDEGTHFFALSIDRKSMQIVTNGSKFGLEAWWYSQPLSRLRKDGRAWSFPSNLTGEKWSMFGNIGVQG